MEAAAQTPALGAAERDVVESLRRDGIAVVRYEELLPEPSWAELQSDVRPFVESTAESVRDAGPAPRTKDDVIVRRFTGGNGDGGPARFDVASPWLRVGLSDTMLGIVNAYRGESTRLLYLDNWFTVPYAGAEERVASQRWHRDPEEEHVVKVFLYLSDVDEGAGPFEYVKGSSAGGRYGELWPWASGKLHPPEDELYTAVDPQDRVTLTGPAGTMLFCDTGGFHRGGFARTSPRILAIWSYVSPTSGRTQRFEVDAAGLESLSGQARAALA